MAIQCFDFASKLIFPVANFDNCGFMCNYAKVDFNSTNFENNCLKIKYFGSNCFKNDFRLDSFTKVGGNYYD